MFLSRWDYGILKLVPPFLPVLAGIHEMNIFFFWDELSFEKKRKVHDPNKSFTCTSELPRAAACEQGRRTGWYHTEPEGAREHYVILSSGSPREREKRHCQLRPPGPL